MQQGSDKPTLQEVLEKHKIELLELYEQCSGVPIREVEVYYENHIGVRATLELILQTVNRLKKERGDSTEDYTLSNIYTRHIYG